MGLFGSLFGKKQQSLFAPGSGPESTPIQKPQGIFNGGSFTGRDAIGLALGAIGDGISQNYGGQAMVAPMLFGRIQQRDKDKRSEDEYQRRRADENSDWQKRQEWERNNPKAPQPTEFERILDAGGFSPEERQKLLQGYAQQRAAGDPIVQTNADGTKTIYPRSILNGAPTIPARPVGKLTPLNPGGPGLGQGGFRTPY